MKQLKINELRTVEVFQLRHVEKWTLKGIAERMGVAIKTVSGIVLGKTHLKLAADHPLRRVCVQAERKKLKLHRRSRLNACRTWKPSEKQSKVRDRALLKGLRAYRQLKSIRKAAKTVGVSPTALHRVLVLQKWYGDMSRS